MIGPNGKKWKEKKARRNNMKEFSKSENYRQAQKMNKKREKKTEREK